jgi:hypothetical protein
MENDLMMLTGLVGASACVIVLILLKIYDRLAEIQRVLERANEMKHEDRTGEWRR